MSPSAAYVHVPFCRHRCGYCNFTLVAGRDDLEPQYLAALERELNGLRRPHPVETLFVGGGTPTHLAEDRLEQFMELLSRWLPLREGGEFSVEANPVDLRQSTLDQLRRFGVNRLSIGVQSFQASVLRTLERDHDPSSAMESVRRARAVFPSVSLDLIFAAPEQTFDQWADDVQCAIDADVDHVSTYGLTYEKGAACWGRLQRGELAATEEELEREMYLHGIATLGAAGYEHYEVSNFARPHHRCRHNLKYWLGEDYLAFGPGASRHHAGRRETNHRSTTAYIRRMLDGQSPVADVEQLSAVDQAHERLVFGLRLREGVTRKWFRSSTGFELDEIAGEAIATHVAAGRMLDDGHRVRLSDQGLLISDAILVDLM